MLFRSLLFNSAFQIGDVGAGRVHELLGLENVHLRSDTSLPSDRDQTQRLLARDQSLPGNFHLQIELPQLEVGGSHVADQARYDGTLAPFRCQQICSRCLGGASTR